VATGEGKMEGSVSTMVGILLANLFQASKGDISAREFPGSSMFKEAIYAVKFPTLRSSPTVAHELAITTAYEKSFAISAEYPTVFEAGNQRTDAR
jgi:hypothetical protein